MHNEIADVAVIGAGIIGVSIAEKLQFEGKQVLLVDRLPPGEGCSMGNAGHFATDVILPLASFETLLKVPILLMDPLGPLSIKWSYFPQLLPWLMRYAWAAMPHKTRGTIAALKVLNRPSITRYQHLLNRTGLNSLTTQRGALTVYNSEAAAKKNTKHMLFVKQHGVKVEQLSGEQVRELEPCLSPSITGGLYYPDTAHSINPHRLVTALVECFQQAGGEVINQEVHTIDTSHDSHVRLKCHGDEILAKQVIIACGAWSKQLVSQVGHKVPLETERGYHLMLPEPNVEITRPISSFERSFVMTPMEEGLRLAGTVELAGLNAAENHQRSKQLYQHAKHILPHISDINATSWMGHRPSLPDSLPVIGRSKINSRMLFAFGHQHLGLTQAAVTADLLNELVHNQPASMDIEPFSIERFS